MAHILPYFDYKHYAAKLTLHELLTGDALID